jgi:sensor histidine kinase YesM
VLKARLEEAYTYITIFSNLVRYALHLSDKEFIEFEQEYKLLDLYLRLEKLRFGESLTYNIETNEGMEDILLPSMIIQPFVENALVHGLLHKKEGSRHLHIAFLLQDDCLLCTVSDNGIGRAAAKKLQQKRGKEYRSFSGEAIRRRFEVLRQQYHLKNMGYVYEDLNDNNGKACGTRVHICLPIRHAY